MVSSRKLRPLTPVEPPAIGRGVNDNVPGIMPGHQLPELDGVPRQPATETVIHYARVAEIGSFPESAGQAQAATSPVPALEPLPVRSPTAKPARAVRGAAAGLVSCLAHAAVFSLLAITMVAVPEEPVEEAGSVVSVTMLGENEFDQLAAGDPDIVQAEEVQPETLTPTEAEPVTAEPVAPVETTPVQPETQPVQSVTAQPVTPMDVQPETAPVAPQETVASDAPQTLAAIVPAEPVVSQPAPVVTPAEPVQPVQPVAPEAVTPVQPQETPPPVVEKPVEPPVAKLPEKKPEPKKPVAREKPVEKPTPKKVVPKKAGSKGDASEDRKRGSADGSQNANANRDGARNAGRNTNGAGSAAVANYPGKVQSKIRRSVRVPFAFRREKASLSVRVRLTIGASGQLSGVSVARSSGVAELDEAVVNGVRRAAPFPPLPPEWGKPSWTFTQEVQVTGR